MQRVCVGRIIHEDFSCIRCWDTSGGGELATRYIFRLEETGNSQESFVFAELL